MRSALPLIVLLLLLPGVARAEGDEDAEVRKLRRTQLLRNANAAVDPTNPAVGGLDDIRAVTQKQRAAFGQSDPEIFARLDALVGTTADAPRGASQGLIRQGARFHRWVIGGLLPRERHADLAQVQAWREAEVGTRLGKARTAYEEKAKEGDPPFDAEGEGKRIREAVLALPVPTNEGGDAKKPAFQLLRVDADPLDIAATPPADPAQLDEVQRTALVYGTLQIRLADGTGPAGSVIRLDGIDLLWAEVGTKPGPDNWRFPLARPDELSWMESRDYVAWRELQVTVRREALADQTVPSLVSDADVEVRRRRLEDFRAEKQRLQARIDAVLEAFDLMAQAQRDWQREVGQKGFEIEEWTGKCENCSPDEETEFKRQLARTQLEERAAQQELRLLYITAVRAEARLKQLRRALALAGEEVVLAEGSLQRYVDAQSRTRRETQLAELRIQAEDLRADRAVVRADLDREGVTAAQRAVIADYMAAVDSMLAANERLTTIVKLRRTLEARAAGKTDVEVARDPALAAPPTNAEAGAPAEGAEVAAPETPVDPLASVRDPGSQDLNESFIVLVREKLPEPGFDADLVAEHYAAADDTIRKLQSALRDVDAADLSTDAFDALMADVRKRIPPRPEVLWHTAYPQILERMRSAFADSLTAIEEKRSQIAGRVALLTGWMDELERLGVRSFKNRKDRTLGTGQLREAGRDFGRGARDVSEWLGLEGEEHAGTFLRAKWLPLLLLLGMIVVSFLVVRYGRRWIDERLTALAQKVPQLRREPITIGAEAQEAKEQREAIEAARKEAEEAALADAAGEG
ncbi:MAG: hypothetical protein QNJ98_17445, partial [Planctomycetota bacterium]|nr:hypothetical protein [Planctomycetota bacterium]